MTLDLDNLITQARGTGPASTRAAARLMSVMTDQPARLAEVLRGSQNWPQPKIVLGITGAPGSGKSTLTDHLAAEYRARFPDRRLGIVAVDPSSPFTGGALLGDRVRMMRHATDPMVFIRSLASRGHLGGLAMGARGVCRVLGLIGCEVVIVETVGVGQSEVEVAQNCDLTMVVLAPGQGDSIQLLKAGLMEAGDLFVVNKADREGADQLFQSLLSALRLNAMARIEMLADDTEHCHGHHAIGVNGKTVTSAKVQYASVDDGPEVFLVSAANHSNITALVDALEKRTALDGDLWREQRRTQVVGEVRQAVLVEVQRRALETLGFGESGTAKIARVLSGEQSVSELADELLAGSVLPRLSRRGQNESEIPCQT